MPSIICQRKEKKRKALDLGGTSGVALAKVQLKYTVLTQVGFSFQLQTSTCVMSSRSVHGFHQRQRTEMRSNVTNIRNPEYI